MTPTSAPPSQQTQAMLKALQLAVAKSLEKKRRLGQYAVVWDNGQAVKTDGDVRVMSK